MPEPINSVPSVLSAEPVRERIGFYETKHSSSCLQKAADDEPIFVIRAQDSSAAAVVQAWLVLNPQISPEKRESAQITLEAMRQWQRKKKAD